MIPLLAVLLVILPLAVYLYWPWRRRYPDPQTLITVPRWDGQAYPLADRLITLDGAFNSRDIGGYPTTDGATVRRGLVYRSGHLADLTPAGQEGLAAQGVQLVCDLRAITEAAQHPDRLPPELVYRNIPVYDRNPALIARLRTLITQRGRMDTYLRQGYADLVVERAPMFGAVLRLLADDDALPVLIHCTAGKDRAGITVALLLAALGVPEPVIVADYTLSNHITDILRADLARGIRLLRPFGFTADDLQPLFIADPANIRAVFAVIRERWGSVDAYLQEAAELSPDALDRLRERLLVYPD